MDAVDFGEKGASAKYFLQDFVTSRHGICPDYGVTNRDRDVTVSRLTVAA
jgi:hypothetical protein